MAEVKGYNMVMARKLKKEAQEKMKGKSQEKIDRAVAEATEKAKGRLMSNVRIDKDGNRYVAVGKDAETGDKMSVIMSADNANAAIKSKHAKKGDGWDEE